MSFYLNFQVEIQAEEVSVTLKEMQAPLEGKRYEPRNWLFNGQKS